MRVTTDFKEIDLDTLDLLIPQVINKGIPWFLLEEPNRSILRLVSRLDEIKPYDNLTQFNQILEGAPLIAEFLFERDYTQLLKKIDKTRLKERWLGDYRPLHSVVCNEHIRDIDKEIVIDKLLSYGESIDYQNSQGETPLFLAIKRNNRAMINMLLRLGANPNIADEIGITPIMVSTYNNHLYNIAILYHYGASLGNQCGIFNLNTYDIADITKVLETKTLLKQLEENIKQL